MNSKAIGHYLIQLGEFVSDLDNKPQWLRTAAANGLCVAAEYTQRRNLQIFLLRAADNIRGVENDVTRIDNLQYWLLFWGDTMTWG